VVSQFSNAGGVTYTGLTTKNLIQYARKFYGCDSITHLPLENDGGAGTVGSHFERAWFGHELMTGSRIDNRTPSAFTLLFLKDTGKYGVD